MCEQSTQWTGYWVADKIKTVNDVQNIEVVESQILNIRRKHDSFMLGTTAVERVDNIVVQTLTEKSHTLSFIINIPKESYWTGEAIDLVSQYSIAFCGMSDLYRALFNRMDVRRYRNPEFPFFERILEQHDIVRKLERIHDRKYIIKRRKLPGFTIVLLNEPDCCINSRNMYVKRRRSVLREHVGALFRDDRCCSWRGSICRLGESCARRTG